MTMLFVGAEEVEVLDAASKYHQAAWVAACVYLVPMTVFCLNKVMKQLK